MTIPADPPDAEILAEYQRRIDSGDPIPSQRSLVERYGMGFSRARRLVDELKRRKATAAAPAVERQTSGAVRHEAAAPHRTAERAPAAPERPRNGAVGAVQLDGRRTGPRPVHRLPVQGAPHRTGSEDQTGAPAPPVHEGGAVTAVRPGDEGGAAAPEQPVTPAGDPGAGAPPVHRSPVQGAPVDGAGTGEGHQPAERGADESGGTLRGWHVAAALVIAVPAFLAVWSGWIGLGEMTGWGERNMLPGLVADGGWATIHTSITLPIGIEAFGALSMAVWLASRNAGGTLPRYAAFCTFGSLALGAFGQVSYHVLTAAGEPAPSWLVGFVAVLPVIVLGASVGLIHLAASNRKRG